MRELRTSTDKILKIVSGVDEKISNIKTISQKPKMRTSTIKQLEHVFHINNIHSSSILSIIQLKDSRIATASQDCSISICSINLETKTWKLDIKKYNAHNNFVYSLSELPGNHLISGSSDNKINVWKITPKELINIQSLSNHNSYIYHVAGLRYNRFASASGNMIVKIWVSQEPFKEIATLSHEHYVWNVLEMKKRDVIVTSCKNSTILFWNLQTFKVEGIVQNVYAGYSQTYDRITKSVYRCVFLYTTKSYCYY